MKQTLTEKLITTYKPPLSGQTIVMDTKLPNFGIRVTAAGSRSFIIEKRIGKRNKRVTIGRYPHINLQHARKVALQHLHDLACGKDPFLKNDDVTELSLMRIYEKYVSARSSLKPSTVKNYLKDINHGFSDWKDKPIHTITRDMVLIRYKEIGNKSKANANRCMRVLRALFNFYMRMHHNPSEPLKIVQNPVDCLKDGGCWYKIDNRNSYIKKTQLSQWHDAVKQLPNMNRLGLGQTACDYLLFCLFTGLRREEAAWLTWNDVSFDDKTITINNTKNSVIHVLPLSDYLLVLLKNRISSSSPYVFPGFKPNKPIKNVYKNIEIVRELSGIEFCLHDLRRTFATIAHEESVSHAVIKRLLNHKGKTDITEQYICSSVEALRQPMQEITNILRRLCLGNIDHNVRYLDM